MPGNIGQDLDKILAELGGQSVNSQVQAVSDEQQVDELVQSLKADVAKEQQLEDAYGNKPVEAFGAEALSSATLGISDAILADLGIVDAERLREVRDRNPVASGLGTAAGILGPLLATGGASAAAKGAATIGAPVVSASRAGLATEKAAAKVLNKIIADTGRKKLAKEVITKAAGAGVEGSMYSLGELVSEDALGNAEFNAENAIAALGHGAVLGAGAGGLLGLGAAGARVATKGIKAASKSLLNKAEKLADPAESALELAGVSLNNRILAKERGMAQKLPDYMRTELGLGVTTSADDLALANRRVLEDSGKRIGTIVKALDDAEVQISPMLPSKQAFYSDEILTLDSIIGELSGKFAGSNRGAIRKLSVLRNDLVEAARAPGNRIFGDLVETRRSLGDIAFNTKLMDKIPKHSDVVKKLYANFNQKIDEVAELIATRASDDALKNAATALKQQNQRYSIAKFLDEPFTKKINKSIDQALKEDLTLAIIGGAGATAASGDFGPGSILAGAGAALGSRIIRGDLRRRLAILADLQKINTTVDKRIADSVTSFFSGGRKAARAASLKVLTGAGLARDKDNKEPKSRKEAFKNISDNMTALQAQPEKLVDRLTKSTAVVGYAAPNTASAMLPVLTKGLEFLQAKLPKSPTARGLFDRPFEPSGLDLAKFERYLQAVENPLTVLEDLEDGTLSREHVEALQAVYPNLYTRLQAAVMERLSSGTMDVPYNKRVQLGILLDIPADQSLQPESVLGLQASFAPQEQQASPGPQGAVKSTVGGIGGIEVASRTASDAQAFLARRSGTV